MEPFVYDLELDEDEGERLAMDESLRTAVLISLLTERRAQASEALDPSDLRGWWGDTYQETPGDALGSRLWTLAGAKAIPATMTRAESYIREALQWMLDDGIASGITVELEAVSATVLGCRVGISRPQKPAPEWIAAWQQSV